MRAITPVAGPVSSAIMLPTRLLSDAWKPKFSAIGSNGVAVEILGKVVSDLINIACVLVSMGSGRGKLISV